MSGLCCILLALCHGSFSFPFSILFFSFYASIKGIRVFLDTRKRVKEFRDLFSEFNSSFPTMGITYDTAVGYRQWIASSRLHIRTTFGATRPLSLCSKFEVRQ